ncbi:hypothetical protein EV673_0426 [Limnobacter thiooxidans]|jgi:uncharacterized protein YjeT (DUF2065 family)|uniref:DUF2065 domain-containing protein n=1 Tax=Limnobacter thiooxidans TaxID=131080 RepID=A0AA86J7J8_9BURK|nr:DUF2065 family protein [Limnobacter sp.]MCZ8014322.1 DUF2065 family protein [Limnobacter sp.]RZS42104.1 hypothetical protein EV673_0426 [Limnobacter thiooxidans]BET26465.1 hypothetical protein RGQ30_19660 [Limnobacter thiooxidans]
MSETLLLALALVCILEGTMPFLFPKQWKEGFLKIASLTEGQIRFVGLVAILIGITLFLF